MTTVDWNALVSAIGSLADGASVDTIVSMSFDEMKLFAQLTFRSSDAAARWTVAADDNGMAVSYAYATHDDSRNMLHTVSETGDFNYALNGTLTGDATGMQLSVKAVAYARITMIEDCAQTIDGNVVDVAVSAPYAITMGPDGRYSVEVGSVQVVDNSEQLDFDSFRESGLILTDDTPNLLPSVIATLNGLCTGLSAPIAATLNAKT